MYILKRVISELSPTKESKRILKYYKKKIIFFFSYLYNLTITIKGFKVIYMQTCIHTYIYIYIYIYMDIDIDIDR